MPINPRYMPGGDKYESIREDERRSFYERVDAEKEEILAALKTTVRTWAENEIEEGNNPIFENFRDEFPEWDNEALYETIGEELRRVKHGSLNASKAV